MEKLFHGNFAAADGEGDFAVDEIIVEGDAGRICAGVSVKDSSKTRPVNGGEAHGAGFATGVEIAVVELKGFEAFAGFANGDDLGVGGWVVGGGDLIATAA